MNDEQLKKTFRLLFNFDRNVILEVKDSLCPVLLPNIHIICSDKTQDITE